MNPLQSLLYSLFSGYSWIFTLFIIALFITDLVSYYKNDGLDHKNLNGLMTGTGILGTFCGIVIGLQDFDTSDISASIGPLLEGLKMSFGTSVAGLFFAITSEFIERVKPNNIGQVGDPAADAMNLHMHKLTDVLKGSMEASLEVADNMKALRSEMKDEATMVRTSLEEALEKLSKGATEEIINALKQVISEFNDNLVEQFGENFKQLNEACLKLVQWQKDYQRSIESSTEALKEAKSQYEAALPKLQEFHSVIAETAEGITSLKAAIITMDENSDELATSLQYLSNQTTSAKKAMEALYLHITNTATKAKEAITHSEQIIENQSHACIDLDRRTASTMQIVVDNVEQVKETSVQTIQELKTNLETSTHTTIDNLEKNLSVIKESNSSALSELKDTHFKANQEMAETIGKMQSGGQITNQNIDKSLTELEKALAALTQDFGGAYKTYLDGMRRLTTPKNSNSNTL